MKGGDGPSREGNCSSRGETVRRRKAEAVLTHKRTVRRGREEAVCQWKEIVHRGRKTVRREREAIH
jgi:hypothetical protein